MDGLLSEVGMHFIATGGSSAQFRGTFHVPPRPTPIAALSWENSVGVAVTWIPRLSHSRIARSHPAYTYSLHQ